MTEDEFVCSPSRTNVWDQNGLLCPYTVKFGAMNLCLPTVWPDYRKNSNSEVLPTRYSKRPIWIMYGGLIVPNSSSFWFTMINKFGGFITKLLGYTKFEKNLQ